MRLISFPVISLILLATACQGNANTPDNAAAAADTGAQTEAEGQAAPAAGDVAAIENFRLTDDFIAKYQAYQEDAAKDPCALSPIFAMGVNDDEDRSLDDVIRAFGAQPGVPAALERNGLTARELILGMSVLVGAAAQEIAQENPEMVEDGEITMHGTISPANMAVYQRHKAALQRHQAELGRQQLEANGGALPACLNDE